MALPQGRLVPPCRNSIAHFQKASDVARLLKLQRAWPVLRIVPIVFIHFTVVAVPASMAQEVVSSLPVSGSLVYNGVFYNRVHDRSSGGIGLRFAGRLAFRVAEHTYIGVGGGSWARAVQSDCSLVPNCRRYLVAQSEAILYHLYIQRYLGSRNIFLRAGSGIAQTRTVTLESRFMVAEQRWRVAVSAGAGADLRIARFLYLTPSIDLTVLPGTDTRAQELRSGWAVGLALTLR